MSFTVDIKLGTNIRSFSASLSPSNVVYKVCTIFSTYVLVIYFEGNIISPVEISRLSLSRNFTSHYTIYNLVKLESPIDFRTAMKRYIFFRTMKVINLFLLD